MLMDDIATGAAGLAKFTISNFPAMLLAIYKRSTEGSKATISAEFVPEAPLEYELNKLKFNSFVVVGAA